jgi:hypothetical protein
MPGLVPGIHENRQIAFSWVAGSSPTTNDLSELPFSIVERALQQVGDGVPVAAHGGDVTAERAARVAMLG